MLVRGGSIVAVSQFNLQVIGEQKPVVSPLS